MQKGIIISSIKDKDSLWELQEHSKVKHQILKAYLPTFFKITTSKHWTEFIYVDGFAGVGKYKGGELGSPLHALNLLSYQANRISRIKKIYCIFIEKNKDNFNGLVENIDEIQYNNKIIVRTYNDEFSNVINGILSEYHDTLSVNPSFFFIDPYGYSKVPFEINQKIFEFADHTKRNYGRPEIFYNLMVGFMDRFMDDESKDRSITKLFGTENWKQNVTEIQRNNKWDLRRAFSYYFRERLISETDAKYTWKYKFKNPKTNKWIYDMIYATTNFKGLKVMKDLMNKIGKKGTFEFHGRYENMIRNQLELTDFMNIEDPRQQELKKFLKNNIITNNTYDYEDLLELIYVDTPYVETDLKQCLKDLERQGFCKIKRIASKRDGIKEGDKISFNIQTTLGI